MRGLNRLGEKIYRYRSTWQYLPDLLMVLGLLFGNNKFVPRGLFYVIRWGLNSV